MKEKIEIWFSKIMIWLRQLIYKITSPIHIFVSDVMQISFSKINKKKILYDISKHEFTFSIKTKDDLFKYLFALLMLLYAILLPFMVKNVGISNEEIKQHAISEAVYHYYTQEDSSVSQYYNVLSTQGQSIDIIAVFICHWFNINDVYFFKHILSNIFIWFTILILSLFILKLFCWRAAFFSALLLFISPGFLGHAFSNLTDIAFSFAFITSLTQIYFLCTNLPIIKWKRIIYLFLSISFAISIHIGGLILLFCLSFFLLIYFFFHNPIRKILTKVFLFNLFQLLVFLLLFSTLIYIITFLYLPTIFPYPFVSPIHGFELFLQNTSHIPQIFNGELITSNSIVSSYLIKYFFIKIPLVVLVGLGLLLIYVKTLFKKLKLFTIFYMVSIPLFFMIKCSHFYLDINTAFDIFLFIYPLLIALSVAGYESVLNKINDRYTNTVLVAVFFFLTFMPLRHLIFNRPTYALYYNELSGGVFSSYGKYELDYDNQINKKATEWLMQYIRDGKIRDHKDVNKIRIGTDGNAGCSYYLRNDSTFVEVLYFDYEDEKDYQWEYYISFANSIPPETLHNKQWPPENTFYTIKCEGKPIVAFIKKE